MSNSYHNAFMMPAGSGFRRPLKRMLFAAIRIYVMLKTYKKRIGVLVV